MGTAFKTKEKNPTYRLSAPVCNGSNSRPDATLDRYNEQLSLSIVSAVTHAGVTGPRLGAFSAGGAVSKPRGLIIRPLTTYRSISPVYVDL